MLVNVVIFVFEDVLHGVQIIRVLGIKSARGSIVVIVEFATP